VVESIGIEPTTSFYTYLIPDNTYNQSYVSSLMVSRLAASINKVISYDNILPNGPYLPKDMVSALVYQFSHSSLPLLTPEKLMVS
jgi:hypothetical protein